MKVYHVCNNYIASKVHKNLISHLSNYFKQVVLIPCRKTEDFDVNRKNIIGCEFNYFIIPNFWLRFFPLLKILYVTFKCYKIFILQGKVDKGSTILAHTLWSDGFPALILSRIFKINYTVVVRNVDINFFIPKLFFYRFLIAKIVKNSESITFVSEAHRARFEALYSNIYNSARSVNVIPNGIDDYWISNVVSKPLPLRQKSALFVGRFDKNKNINSIYKVIKELRLNYPELSLTLIGGNVADFMLYTGVKYVPDWVNIMGIVSDKEVLSEEYRKAGLFFMPSFTETFGLVYFEAISQGCPIVATINEGIYGYIMDDYVRFNKPDDLTGMKKSIIYLLDHYSNGIPLTSIHEQTSNLNWSVICSRYIKAMGLYVL